MKAKTGILFLLLVLTIKARIKPDGSDHIRKRSGYQSFSTNQIRSASNPKQQDEKHSANNNATPTNATNRKLGTASKDYFDLIKTGRPNRPKPKSRYRGADECVLYAEFMPLYYNILTRTSDFTIGFSSNCLTYVEVNFKIEYKANKLINWFLHPDKVRLDLWGNQYLLNFRNKRLIDKFDINRAFEYRQIVIDNLMAGRRRLKTNQRNMTYLDPQSRYTFNNFTVNKLMKVNGRVKCKLETLRPPGYQKMMIKRRKFIDLMRKRGEPEDEIKKALKNKKFSAARKLHSSERKLTQTDRSLNKTKSKTKQTKPANKRTKKTRKGRSRRKESDMTREERLLYNQNRKKMQVRLRRNFIRGHEIVCSIR